MGLADKFKALFKSTKLELMRDDLLTLVRERRLVTDGELVLHCITGGVLPGRVAPDVYKQLKSEGTLKMSKMNMPRYSRDALSEPEAPPAPPAPSVPASSVPLPDDASAPPAPVNPTAVPEPAPTVEVPESHPASDEPAA